MRRHPKVKEPVPLDECKRRALVRMASERRGYLFRPSQLAYAIWPGVEFRAQGAGAAASRILKRMIEDDTVRWCSQHDGSWQDWGYELTPKGRLEAVRARDKEAFLAVEKVRKPLKK